MNKLRKPKPPATYHSASSSTQTAGSSVNQCLLSVQSKPPVSRTMQIASASLVVERTSTSNNMLECRKTTWYSSPAAAKPRTFVEQYWAARALVAETVLTTRVQHQKEMAEVRLGMEEKRTNQFAAFLRRANNGRAGSKSSSCVALTCLCSCVQLTLFIQAALVACFMLLFLALIYILLRDSPKSKGTSHFTIPILSPFTSVVSSVNRRCKVWIISNGTRLNMKRHYQCEIRINLYCRSRYLIICHLPTFVVKKKIVRRVVI
ncbi:uncharacterized protein BJ212DRAFT_73673 [Suillus subaureus]|uniref:Transmembrane protein n=1 Tax=Suillus subaureus TaxID=48587 RepID=A0A9P7EEQ6_9AGAM|nr:uncharacterized protein BJ212DRAFT_73673 [Suillus subaureus]KAG1819141.1 hypothetical protein BJ212DRAFT_73673 [Suillus subaureus]